MKSQYLNLLLILWAVIVLPNSGVRVNVDDVISTEVVQASLHIGFIAFGRPHYEIRILYNTAVTHKIRYNEGERWACEEDYVYLMDRLK